MLSLSRADTKASPKQPSFLAEHSCRPRAPWRRRQWRLEFPELRADCLWHAGSLHHASRKGEGFGAPALVGPAGPPWAKWAWTGAPNHADSFINKQIPHDVPGFLLLVERTNKRAHCGPCAGCNAFLGDAQTQPTVGQPHRPLHQLRL